MITVHANTKGVLVSKENLTMLLTAGLVHYSIERLRFEGISTRVSPYVIETFVTQVNSPLRRGEG